MHDIATEVLLLIVKKDFSSTHVGVHEICAANGIYLTGLATPGHEPIAGCHDSSRTR